MINQEKIAALAKEYEVQQLDFEPIITVLGRIDCLAFKARFLTKFHAELFYNRLEDFNFIHQWGWEAIFVDGTFQEKEVQND